MLLLTGTAGLVRGSVFTLPPGDQADLGRSRACGMSLHSLERAVSPEAKAFRTISRCHVRLRHLPIGEVEISDKSRHGTFLDGDRIETAVLSDLAERSHELRLGAVDAFRLELA